MGGGGGKIYIQDLVKFNHVFQSNFVSIVIFSNWFQILSKILMQV